MRLHFRPLYSILAVSVCLAWVVLKFAGSAGAESNQGAKLKISISDGVTLEADDWWKQINSPLNNVKEFAGGLERDGRLHARASIRVLRFSSPEKALDRLKRAAASAPTSKVLTIAGRPALSVYEEIELERRVRDAAPLYYTTQRVTTFVAIDRVVVEITATLAHGADKGLMKRLEEFAQGLKVATVTPGRDFGVALADMRRVSAMSKRALSPLLFGFRGLAAVRELETRVTEANAPVLAGHRGELEVAVSPNGTDIVIGSSGGTVFSNDGGATWSAPQAFPVNMGLTGVDLQRRGDPSVARGPSGRFYLSYLGNERHGAGDCDDATTDCRHTVSVAFSEPAERGAGFDFASHVAVCDAAAPPAERFGTDQPHIAVGQDPSGLNGEAVYVVWRRHLPTDATTPGTCNNLGAAEWETVLSCSVDGGQHWSASTRIDETGRHPRLGVGQDGKVYVVTVNHSHGGTIRLTRTSRCSAGLTIDEDFLPDGVEVDNFDGVDCPVPGLDRCNNGNTLSSPTVSPDPLNAQTVFVSFATHTANGNENVIVRASEDGGLTFPVSGIANDTNVTGRRYMPWSCAVPNGVYVGWYDRAAATAADNDLTRYHAAFLHYESARDTLRRFDMADLSRGVSDPQCALWPRAPRDIGDSENCSRQPQLAGRTPGADGTCENAGNPPCDFSDAASSDPGLNCCVGSGRPKYGDYNGIACAGQRAFVAWASATAPAGAAAPSADLFGVYFAVVNHRETLSSDCLTNILRCLSTSQGGLVLDCQNRACEMEVPVPELCQQVIQCPGCGPDQLCLGREAMTIEGLPPDAQVRLVDLHGRVLAQAKRRGDQFFLPTRSNPFDAKTRGAGLALQIRVSAKGQRYNLKLKG